MMYQDDRLVEDGQDYTGGCAHRGQFAGNMQMRLGLEMGLCSESDVDAYRQAAEEQVRN